jgi:hypothetical protein
MSIITSVPALNVIVKGVGSTFTLDKTALSINSVVAASPYYSDMNNWDRVTVVYRSSVGTQSVKVVVLSAGDPSGNIDTAINVDSSSGLYGRYFGTGNTATDSLILPNTVNRTIGTHNFQITRTGSNIVGTVDGVILFNDTYSGTLYLMAMITQTSGSKINSAVLI